LRALRQELYNYATLCPQALLSMTDRTTEELEVSGKPRLENVPQADRITARMRLLAPTEVFDRWQELLESEEAAVEHRAGLSEPRTR
jgi:hypothetical protein